MKEKDIFKEKAENGYTSCFADKCPLKERCLHYLVGLSIKGALPALSGGSADV